MMRDDPISLYVENSSNTSNMPIIGLSDGPIVIQTALQKTAKSEEL
jgi:hypothetical protein